ncbi:MAG: gluconate 2-dehydrogenase subunit 3 family protein [Terriglobia bacterium]
MDDANHGTTRRQWLLRLGRGVVLTGFSGVAGELAADTLASQQAALPPGLYLPSNDHLTHALTSDERFRSVPPGSETDYVRPRTGPFVPQFFSAEQFPIVRRLVELFLGDSPQGASTVDEVAEWIDLIVFNAEPVCEAVRRLSPEHRAVADHYHGPEAMRRLETSDPQKVWREGLEWLAAESQRRFGMLFLTLTQDEQLDLLRTISDGRADMASEDAGARLFELLKSQTLDGFYTSRAGVDELDYQGNTYHAECPGCAIRR